MNRRFFDAINLATITLVLILGVSACTTDILTPETSFQGRLTDADGNLLNGTHNFTFKMYHSGVNGTSIYTETESINVTAGLFDTAIGPSGIVANLSPEELTKPLYLEVTVANGTYTETLSPRQRLYGSPYAFTLMPGAFISATLDTNTYGGALDAILTINNGWVDSGGTNPALPTLRVFGETGIELTGPGASDDGSIYSGLDNAQSDLFIHSNDELWVYLDDDNDSTSYFIVYAGDGSEACRIEEDGDLVCAGTKSAVVEVEDDLRRMYAIESSEIWFEDFGAGELRNGMAVISVDALFARTVSLDTDYHVYLTPLGDCNGLYVANKTSSGFEVRELGGGTSSAGFDYRVVAKRIGYEDVRMEKVDSMQEALEQEAKEEGR
ncbi:MAG: hypothetical protein GY805_30415 [Chloroflexi bacterium]|nr:hypothetical protein [Chloroflexota bacterium]